MSLILRLVYFTVRASVFALCSTRGFSFDSCLISLVLLSDVLKSLYFHLCGI